MTERLADQDDGILSGEVREQPSRNRSIQSMWLTAKVEPQLDRTARTAVSACLSAIVERRPGRPFLEK